MKKRVNLFKIFLKYREGNYLYYAIEINNN